MFATVAIILQCINVSTQHVVHVKLTECYLSVISEFRKKFFVCARSPSVIFIRKNKNEYKILAALANSTTRWRQVTSGGIALHLKPLGLGDQRLNRGVCKGHGKGRNGIFVCFFICFWFWLCHMTCGIF